MTSYAQPYFSKAIDLNIHGRERIKKFVIIDSLIYASTGQRCANHDCTSLVKMNLSGGVIDYRLFPWLDGGDQEYVIHHRNNIVMSGHGGFFQETKNYLQQCNLQLDSLQAQSYSIADSITRLTNKSIVQFDKYYVLIGFVRPLNDLVNVWPGQLIWIDTASLETDTIMIIELENESTSFSEAFTDNDGFLNIHFRRDDSFVIGRRRGVIRFNAEKEIVSIWEAPFQNTTTIVENMVLLKNGNIVIMEQDDVNDYELMFQTYDGEYLFSSILESTGYDSKTPFELKVARNGDIIGCGVYQSTQIDTFECCIYTGYIFRMSPDGELLWERIIIDYDSTGQYKDGTFTDIHELPNGDLILGGDIEALRLPEHDLDMWLVRTDSMGCLTPGCGEIQVVTGTKELLHEDHSRNEFRCYPNPAADQISFEVHESRSQRTVEFEIRDIYGQVKIAGSVNTLGTTDISALADGIYIVSFVSRGQVLAIERFIKITQR